MGVQITRSDVSVRSLEKKRKDDLVRMFDEVLRGLGRPELTQDERREKEGKTNHTLAVELMRLFAEFPAPDVGRVRLGEFRNAPEGGYFPIDRSMAQPGDERPRTVCRVPLDALSDEAGAERFAHDLVDAYNLVHG